MSQRWNVPMEIGCAAVYSAPIATGYWIYGNYLFGSVLTTAAAVCAAILIITWKRVNATSELLT